MSLMIKSSLAAAAVDAVVGMVDVGEGDASQLIIFSGTAPLSVHDDIDPDGSLVLVTFDLPSPSFGNALLIGDAAEALAFSVPMAVAADTGEASFFRIYDKDGVAVMQGDVDDEGQPTCLLNQINVTVGSEVSVIRLIVGMTVE